MPDYPTRWRIRQAEPQDLDALVRLEAEAGETGWSRAAYEGELRNSVATLWVVDANQHVVALMVAWTLPGEVQLQNVVVARAWRRRGIGRALMATLLEHARRHGAQSVELEVRSGNHPARRLYAALGFAEVGRRRAYYRATGEDAVLMRLSLSS